MIPAAGHGFLKDEALLTVVISPRHLAHTMDKRTRANYNGELKSLELTRISGRKI